MTATPTSSSAFEGIRKAGAKFGLDLAGLFDDEGTEGTATGFEGLVPSFKVTSQLKGRSPGTLTFKQPSEPARTTEFKLAPELSSAVNVSQTQTQSQAQKEEPQVAPEKKFYGYVGGASVPEIGNKGFGLKDLTAALDAGYSMGSIKDWVESQRNNLYNIGPGAQEALGIKGYVSTTPGVFDFSQYGAAGFGMKDVEALRSQGVDDTTLKRLAANAPMVGGGAAAALGYTPTEQQRTESVARAYDPASAGGTGFGMKDVEALQAQGVSREQMREIARRSPTIGGGAASFLGL
jgi:hypothetical protein